MIFTLIAICVFEAGLTLWMWTRLRQTERLLEDFEQTSQRWLDVIEKRRERL